MREFIYDVTHLGQLWGRAFKGWRTRDYWRDPEKACGFVSSIFAIASILVGAEAILLVWYVEHFK